MPSYTEQKTQLTVGNQLLIPACLLHPQLPWVPGIAEPGATSGVENTQVSTAALHLTTVAKPTQAGCKHCWSLLFQLCSLHWNSAKCYSPGGWYSCLQTRMALCWLHSARGRACLPQRPCYKVSWITRWLCYSLSEQMMYSFWAWE